VAISSCGVSPTNLDFGTVNVGATGDKSFTITNTGNTRLTGVVSESCPEFSLVGGTTYDLAPTQQATFTIRFSPTSAGDKSCTIDTGELCAGVSANGTGQAAETPPACQLSATTIDFADVIVGQSADRSLTVTNTGGGSLSGTLGLSCPAITIVGNTSYDLGPQASATFTLRFAPTALGDWTCSLDAGTSCGAVALRGRGVAPPPPPACQLSAVTHDFGDVKVGAHKDFSLAIRNIGGGQLCGTASEDCDTFSLVSGPDYCAVPGTPFNLKIRFAPTQTGTFQCVIDPGSGCPTVTVTGRGVPN
jgi:hypothetical protein